MTGIATPPDAPASGSHIAAKADPETLVLRARPARVTRFRRGVIVALTAAGSTAIIGVTWLGLRPATLSLTAVNEDRQVTAKAPPEVLAGAPASYGDVPQLGPPLPGDLGRPILEHQAAMLAPDVTDAQRTAQEAEAERQRIAAAHEAARESGVMLQLAGNPSRNAATPPTADGPPDPATDAAVPAAGIDPARDANGQQRKNALIGRTDTDGDINPHGLTQPVSPYMLTAGSVIAASLITGLNSDLPGFVTAQVTENVYDSVTGLTLLIPQGARLIGRYDSVVAFGQSRALVIWQRIIMPDGRSIRIDNEPAADTQGYAGLSDGIDRHGWQLLKGVALATLLGAGTELSFGSTESDLVRAIRESAQQSGARAGDQLVTHDLDVQPTLRVRPGWPLRIVVHKDIVLAPWEGVGR